MTHTLASSRFGMAPSTSAVHDERRHRQEANRAVGWSAVGLGLTGLVELGSRW